MPVPVTVTNPEGRGIAAHQNKSLPSGGSLFANLSGAAAAAGLQAQQDRQARKAREADAPSVRGTPVGNAAAIKCTSSVQVHNLEFRWTGDDGLPLPGPPCLKDVNLKLQRGSRMLLVGANGAGKTTLLQILAGKHMVPKDAVRILEQPPFHAVSLTTNGNLSYIGGNWERDIAFAGYAVPLTGDFPASRMLNSVPNVDPARRKRLVEVLDIDESWRMHLVSDGQRRRVQIACGLLRPADVLLLDEVTVDLDVLVREDLMEFLREEADSRGCTIIYITHIFDGLESWPTHIGWMADGKFELVQEAHDMPELRDGLLMESVEKFLLRHQKRRLEAIASGKNPKHPESKSFTYLTNNGYGAGRLNTTLASRWYPLPVKV